MTVIFYVGDKDITSPDQAAGWYMVDDKGNPPIGPFDPETIAHLHAPAQEYRQ
jgi:hypothetical protein